MTVYNRQMVHQILRDAYDQTRKHYYDVKMHGLDWDARYHEYDARIDKAGSLGDGFAVVAAFLGGLHDSHTFFMPPERATRFDSGYSMKIVGDRCFVTALRSKSDAEAKLHLGDEIVHYNRFNVNREDYNDLRYYYRILAPQPAAQLDLNSPAGENRQIVINTAVRPSKRIMDLTQGDDVWDIIRRGESEDRVSRQRYVEDGDVLIWKMPEFYMSDDDLNGMMGRVRKHKSLVLDLRGNPGGSVETLDRLLGNFFDHEVKVADVVGRKPGKAPVAKPHGHAYDGKVIVLVDSDSASAAELFARVVQLEHRGTVIGDRTAGAVMEAQHFESSQGADTKIFYSFSVTVNDLAMKDGKSLEHTGVTPDQLMLPTAKDLAEGRDPVLAHAVEEAGGKLDAAAAGKLFPVEWLPL